MSIQLSSGIRSTLPETENNFSFITGNEPLWERSLINSIEVLFGRNKLLKLYHSADPDQSIFSRLLEGLNIETIYDDRKLRRAPVSGPLVIVSNHPYGIVDGVIICNYIKNIRKDYSLITNTHVTRVFKDFQKEVRDELIAIDFSSSLASEYNLSMRKKARVHLRNNKSLIAFPAGEISSSNGILGTGIAIDANWHPFVSSLILQCKANVLPVYIEGQNSALFQLLNRLGDTANFSLSSLLIYREIIRLKDKKIKMTVGDVIPYSSMQHIERNKLTELLRNHTLSLGVS